MFIPRTFALHVELDDGADPNKPATSTAIGWGMTLPDGSVVAIDWRNGRFSTTAVCSSATRAALMYGAELVWFDPPVPPDASRP